MAATLIAARGVGPAPAWGPEALTPDWENREVSTGVRKDSRFRRCAQILMRWKDRPDCVGRTGTGAGGRWSVLCWRQGRGTVNLPRGNFVIGRRKHGTLESCEIIGLRLEWTRGSKDWNSGILRDFEAPLRFDNGSVVHDFSTLGTG